MKYRFTHLPNTQAAKRFKVQSGDSKNQAFFNFEKEILTIWGNPLEDKLQELMIAYVKRNGWAKEPVAVNPENSLHHLNQNIASLAKQQKAGA